MYVSWKYNVKVYLCPFANICCTSFVLLLRMSDTHTHIYVCHRAKKQRGRENKMSGDMTKPTRWVCAQRRLRSAWASAQSDQSLRCPHEESLGPYLPIRRPAKTLIRLGGCPGWSESSLGAKSLCWFCHVVTQVSFPWEHPKEGKRQYPFITFLWFFLFLFVSRRKWCFLECWKAQAKKKK